MYGGSQKSVWRMYVEKREPSSSLGRAYPWLSPPWMPYVNTASISYPGSTQCCGRGEYTSSMRISEILFS